MSLSHRYKHGRHSRLRYQSGVLSVEFGLGAMALFASVFAVIELARYVYIANMTDTTLSETTRQVRIYEGERYAVSYQQRLEAVFNEQDSIWNVIGMVSAENFSYHIEPYADLLDVANGKISYGCERCPIVVYELGYDYSPVLFGDMFWSGQITRRLLTIQEHEGWQNEE